MNLTHTQSCELLLTDRQLCISSNLKNHKNRKNNETFDTLYISAIEVLNRIEIKHRFLMAAQCLREILEKLPETIAGMEIRHVQLEKEMIKKLREKWASLAPTLNCQNQSDWESKSIDSSVISFLIDFDSIIEKEKHGKTKKDIKIVLIRHFFQEQVNCRRGFIEQKISEWLEFENYFISIAHSKIAKSDEFNKYLEKFENFLYFLFEKSKINILKNIDDIIKEGESK